MYLGQFHLKQTLNGEYFYAEGIVDLFMICKQPPHIITIFHFTIYKLLVPLLVLVTFVLVHIFTILHEYFNKRTFISWPSIPFSQRPSATVVYISLLSSYISTVSGDCDIVY